MKRLGRWAANRMRFALWWLRAVLVAICAFPLRLIREIWQAATPAKTGKGRRAQRRAHREETPLDLFSHAMALGAVQENQFNGLGSLSIDPGCSVDLMDVVNRNIWMKALVLSSDAPTALTVESITVAGLPINIGSAGAPLSLFAHDSTRFGLQTGRRCVMTGQAIRIRIRNNDPVNVHSVSGAVICDELNPYMTQLLWEKTLVKAAVDLAQGSADDIDDSDADLDDWVIDDEDPGAYGRDGYDIDQGGGRTARID